MWQHRYKAKSGRRSVVCCHIRALWKAGQDYTATKVLEVDDERAAHAEEMRLIALYGRATLTNRTDGGDGISNPPADVRAKLAAARKGKVATEATRHRLSLAHRGKEHSDETKAKIAAAQTGTKKPWASAPRSAEHRAKLGWFKGGTHSEATKAKMRIAKQGHTVSQATRDKISATKRAKKNHVKS